MVKTSSGGNETSNSTTYEEVAAGKLIKYLFKRNFL